MTITKFENRSTCHICLLISKKTGKVLVCETMGYYTTNTAHLGTLHAEERAINKLHGLIKKSVLPQKELNKGVHLFTYRITKNGKIGMGKPCIRCIQHILKNTHIIRSIQWTNAEGKEEPVLKINEIENNLSDFKRSGGDPRS